MSESIETEIKEQYAKHFVNSDWTLFKSTAEYYLETAARVLKKDIKYGSESLKLLHRNIQKRLYIGIACELLLKAFYLKNEYCINKVKNKKNTNGTFPFKLNAIDKDDFNKNDTITLHMLIEGVLNVSNLGDDKEIIIKGLKIAKTFRNKEGHVVVLWHNYEPQNYRDIEHSLTAFYKIAFGEKLNIHFSVGDGEDAVFNIQNG
jgi:hypothetical protein